MKSTLLLATLLLSLAAPLSASEPATPATPAPAPAYPLETCVVSGEALGSMGDAYVHIHQEEGKPDREVRLCCKGCLKRFAKDPAKYIGKLDAAEKPAAPAADAHSGHEH